MDKRRRLENRLLQNLFAGEGAPYLSLALLLIGLAFGALYLFTVCLRITYPYELEWMEGTLLLHSLRLARGQAVFAPPGAEFIPYLYTPLYYTVTALPVKIFGPHLWTGRLVSFLASLGISVLIYKTVRRESENPLAALLASCLFVAGYRFTGAWMDIVRVDTFQLFWLLLGFYCLKFLTGPRGVLWGAIAFTLAYMTKQSAPIFAVCAALALVLEDRANFKRALYFLLLTGFFSGTIVLAANRVTDNWFWYYITEIMMKCTQYTFTPELFTGHFLTDLTAYIPLSMLIILGWHLWQIKRPVQERLPLFWSMAFVAGFTSSMLMRSKAGGYTNAHLSLWCFAAVLLGLIADRAQRLDRRVWQVLAAALLIQFYRFAYNPFSQAPSEADYRAGAALIEKLAASPGPVLVASHPYYGVLAGKKMTMQDMALNDILFSGGSVPADLERNLRQGYYDIIIIDEAFDKETERGKLDMLPLHLVDAAYEEAAGEELWGASSGLFLPKTGYRVRPRFVYRPREKVELTIPHK